MLKRIVSEIRLRMYLCVYFYLCMHGCVQKCCPTPCELCDLGDGDQGWWGEETFFFLFDAFLLSIYNFSMYLYYFM